MASPLFIFFPGKTLSSVRFHVNSHCRDNANQEIGRELKLVKRCWKEVCCLPNGTKQTYWDIFKISGHREKRSTCCIVSFFGIELDIYLHNFCKDCRILRNQTLIALSVGFAVVAGEMPGLGQETFSVYGALIINENVIEDPKGVSLCGYFYRNMFKPYLITVKICLKLLLKWSLCQRRLTNRETPLTFRMFTSNISQHHRQWVILPQCRKASK